MQQRIHMHFFRDRANGSWLLFRLPSWVQLPSVSSSMTDHFAHGDVESTWSDPRHALKIRPMIASRTNTKKGTTTAESCVEGVKDIRECHRVTAASESYRCNGFCRLDDPFQIISRRKKSIYLFIILVITVCWTETNLIYQTFVVQRNAW